MENQQLWEKCVAFHGHECGGLAIGFQAALYAAELLGLTFSQDEEVVCLSENDACGIDAIQVILGCTAGKGNLLLRVNGKQAWSFYSRNTGRSLRLVLKPRPQGKDRHEMFLYYRDTPAKELFLVKDAPQPMPRRAKICGSRLCDGCGEETGTDWLTLREGRYLCPACLHQA